MPAWRWLAAYAVGLFVMVGIGNWHAIVGGSHSQTIHILDPTVRISIIFLTIVILPKINDRLQRGRETAPRFETTRARSGAILPPALQPKLSNEAQEPVRDS
jgi:hypothetical protein